MEKNNISKIENYSFKKDKINPNLVFKSLFIALLDAVNTFFSIKKLARKKSVITLFGNFFNSFL